MGIARAEMKDLFYLRSYDVIDAWMTMAENRRPDARFQIDIPFSLTVIEIAILTSHKISLDDLMTFQNVIHPALIAHCQSP